MDEAKLIAFIRRIIDTSPNGDSASLALGQLKSILENQLDTSSSERLDQIIRGAADDLPTMQSSAQSGQTNVETLAVAAQRARQVRIQREMEERQGRC